LGDGIAFVGDTLFAGSCGRTDFVGGDHDELMRTLARLKKEIPPRTTLLCGHGPATTMEQELATNPWLR
jgi:glyoxylase-like metal-dependent hydrolase (beta-lactamase superfamily II)